MNRIISINEVQDKVIEVVVEGPQGPSGLSIPTVVVTEFPVTPEPNTLYIKVV